MGSAKSGHCDRVSFFLFPCLMFFAFACASPRAELPPPDTFSDDPSQSVVIPRAELSSTQVVDGSIVLVTLNLPHPNPKAVQAFVRFLDKKILMYPRTGRGKESGEGQNTQVYQAILAIPFGHQPGKVPVEVVWEWEKKQAQTQLTLEVNDGGYPSEVLKVNPKHVSPSPKNLRRIKREAAEIAKIYSKITPKKYWENSFELPIESPVTSIFGSKRVYNGQLKSVHRGLDLKAAIGAPIYAPAAGKVVLAKDLFFTGNTVILDHGYGLFTVYAHLSKLSVKKGEIVPAKGQLGLAGMTGRASGPHLHWGAVVHDVKFNPTDLTKVAW